MSICEVHARAIDNKVLYSALNEVDSIVNEFEMKMERICSILGKEMRRLTDDSETAAIIGEIIERLKTICEIFFDADPNRNFTNKLFDIAINGFSKEYDYGYEEDGYDYNYDYEEEYEYDD